MWVSLCVFVYVSLVYVVVHVFIACEALGFRVLHLISTFNFHQFDLNGSDGSSNLQGVICRAVDQSF